MENIFLFLAISFLFIFLIGKVFEKIRVPWVFAALFLGVILAINNPFANITSSDTFDFLAHMGMYFLLFLIGLEINLQEIKKKGGFIVRSAFFIILLEAVVGGVLIHYVFDYSWFISCLVALSFATVGEAVLVPILDEFGAVNTRLGQSLIGIGTIDDVIEMIVLVIVTLLIGAGDLRDVFIIFSSLLALVVLTVGLRKLKESSHRFSFPDIETVFFFIMFVFLLFVGIGYYAEAAPLAALLAGLSVKNFIPKERLGFIDSEIKAMAYGFFVPIFFLWVGAGIDMSYILTYPLLIILIVVVAKGTKVLGSFIAARKELGNKQSILLGIGLSVRFSTSIVIIKILLDNNLIDIDLYSILIASSMVFKFVVPVLFANLLVRWGVVRKGVKRLVPEWGKM